MHIGLTIYGSLSERSGGFRYDRELLRHLKYAGHRVSVVELPWRWYPRGLLDSVAPAMGRALDVDVDVMLQDELAHPSLLGHTDRLPYPVVSIVHHLRAAEHRPLAPLYRAIEYRYLRSVDGVICNSTATRETVLEPCIPDRTTLVVPPAGDQFDPTMTADAITQRAHEGPLRLVFLGNLIERKGLDTLIKGLSSVTADWTLTVVGHPTDRAYTRRIRTLIERNGLTEAVTMAGELTDTELRSVLRESHLLAVPSQYEGFGIVYLEGMSFGLPAIATTAGGATDIVSDGTTGVLVNPGDATAITTAVQTLANNRDRLAEMGTAARARYERHPTWAESASRVETFLEDIRAADG